ncbi:MAG TPA: ABC transporter permease [Kouleothrix sp.]|uniref:nickel transporter permease n=1 Tax=Kouleothrix sp. TaxID=2779161 RepID=UPI002D0B25F6|nr:ABC transporter permease [Kouleothrix sp.]HRC74856.1 ABC transporter permease [Kouleothrix sp.]
MTTVSLDNTTAAAPVSRRRQIASALRQPAVAASVLILLLFVLAALFAPLLSPADPLAQNVLNGLKPPSGAHLFGTDKLGRELVSRILYGARISLLVGAAVVLISGILGTLLGVLAGYVGGWVDEALMRVTDIFFAFPALILAMAIAGALGPSLQNALIAISAVTWPVYARLLRGQVLALKEREFVLAARTVGVPEWRIILRHLLPNMLAPLLVQASFDMGGAITSVAGLSFIGFGAQPPTPEWGVMISEARTYMATAWWMATFPALSIMLVVGGFNLLGDGLRDLLDPRLRGR